MKIAAIVGARPQFIKSAPVSRALRAAGHRELLVHTGQHYDDEMSAVFFRELGLPEPDVNLGVGSGSHGWQTGQMLAGIEEVVQAERPDCVLVYGDTNSTLAGALVAAKLRVPLAHVEAGLRSFNREMPEEHNRVLTDHCADLLFCPTTAATVNLAREGISAGVHLVGDPMYDAMLTFGRIARERSSILDKLRLEPHGYLLATVHRASNTDDADNLRCLLAAFLSAKETVVFPVHPRTRARIAALDDGLAARLASSNVRLLPPVGYLDMLVLEQHARLVLTDSGGVQKEAYFFGVPCVTLREETEWTETVEAGWNTVAGVDLERIGAAIAGGRVPRERPPLFGDGDAAGKIAVVLAREVAP